MSKKKVILITGIQGFIGSALAEYLRKKYNIIGIDRGGGVLHESINFYQQDINDEPMFKDKVYAVIHLAARAGVRNSYEEFNDYVKDNIIGTKSVLDNCIKYWKPERIYIASSSSIYGERHSEEYQPKSFYALTKVATEQIAETYRNSGLIDYSSICCMRIFTVYGPKQRKGLAFREFIDKILKDEPITIYGDGTQLRDFSYIDDLCKAIENELESNIVEFKKDMGNGNTVELNHVIYLISKILDKDIRIKYEDWNQYDVFKTCSNSSTIKNPTPLEVGLRRQIDWQKEMLRREKG